MRVTNEQVLNVRDGFFNTAIVMREYDDDGNKKVITAEDLAADLLEARELIKEMREVIQDSKRFHVNTLENGRDRIVSLGGLCDSVEDMERGDRLVRNANAILEKTKEYAE